MEFNPTNTIIIFDVHDVLFKPHYREIISLLWNSNQKLILAKYCFHPKLLYTIARMWQHHAVADAYFDYVRKNYPELAPCIPLVIRMANAQIPNTDVIEIIKHLKGQGFPLHILSNIDTLIFADLQKRYPSVFDYFDVIKGTTIQDRYGKPNINIFKNYISAFNPQNKKMIFIDNKKANIQASQRVGMIGILFKNGHQLKAKLQSLGINA